MNQSKKIRSIKTNKSLMKIRVARSGRLSFSATFLLLSLLCFRGTLKAVEPTTPATLLTLSVSNCNEVDINWTNGDGTRRLVIGSAGSPVSQFPSDGIAYVAGSIFGSGTHLGNNNYVVYSAMGNSVTVTALNANKTYYFAVFEYNGTGGSSDYLTSIYPEEDTVTFGVAVTITASDTVLCAGSSVTLEASGAFTYNWSPGSGLSSTFGSTVTASPTNTTRYSVLGTDIFGCQAYERITLTVNPVPSVSLSSQGSVCIDEDPYNLTGGSPSGGTYSGPGVSNGEFDPADAGTGFHTITYTYTNAQGCSSSASRTLTVNSLPNVSLSSFADRCFNASDLNLTGGSPAGGTYSGPGVSGNQFDPSDAGTGTHTITYSYTNAQGCSNSATSSITVNASPSVTLSGFNTVCVDAAPFALTGGSPAGGTYTGPSVSSGVFNPATAGVGTHTIQYKYTNSSGCSDSTTATIQVAGLPSVTMNPLNEVCLSAPPFALSGGNPTGGVYSGNGVDSNLFSASIADTGVHTITYTYTNSNGCVNSANTSIRVNPGPEVTLGTFNDVCANTGPVQLTSGFPAGGVYSGNAVGGTTFFTGIAGAGTHTIIYSYTDSNTCVGRDTQYIEVRPVPVVSLGPDTTICQDVSIRLDAGAGFSSYLWNTGANTQTIDIDTSGRGTGTFSFRVSVSNIYSCIGRDTVLVTFDICSGLPDAGSLSDPLLAYPNPFQSTFVLYMNERFDLSIYDQAGRLVSRDENLQGRYENGDQLQPGIYFLELKTDRRVLTTILIKTR